MRVMHVMSQAVPAQPVPAQSSFVRYLAIDLHKRYLMIGGLDAQQRVVMPPRKIDLHRWPAWAATHLTQADAVVVEATLSRPTYF